MLTIVAWSTLVARWIVNHQSIDLAVSHRRVRVAASWALNNQNAQTPDVHLILWTFLSSLPMLFLPTQKKLAFKLKKI